MAGPPILVVGGRGQLARAMARRADVDGHSIVCRGRPEADLANPATLNRLLDTCAPAAVVNAAAYTGVDAAEADAEAAFAINAEGPGRLARLCADRQIPLVHISTDYVFDGSAATPYREADPIAPLGVYGASKAAGEDAVRRECPRHVILRTSWLYSLDGHNFLTTMPRLGAERDELAIVDDQHGTPTWTADVAAAIAAIVPGLLAAPADGPWGTYHLTNAGATTWFGFATEIFRLAGAGNKRPRLTAITTADYPTPAQRPRYSVLDNRKLADTFGISLPPWQESLARCLADGPAKTSEEKVA